MPTPNKESLQHRIQSHLAYKLGLAMIGFDKARQNSTSAGGGGIYPLKA